MKKNLYVTDNRFEMEMIGRKIALALPELYSPLMMEKMMEGVESYIPEASPEKKEEMVYRAIYDYWVHGCKVDEEFYFHFDTKSEKEKKKYLVGLMRCSYVHHLNSGGGVQRVRLFSDKYKLYERLKPYYLRDVIQIESEEDYPVFEAFVRKHEVFVVKPCDYFYGLGVHKASIRDYHGDIKLAFDRILNEGKELHARHQSRKARMVIEELIIQHESLAAFHPESVNAIRATAVRGKDGKIHLFHPWIKVGINGTFVASAALNGFDAEIDPETGIVITDGYQESGNVYSVHPNSGIVIKGFQIPQWKEMRDLVEELMEQLPEYGYIGWDLVLTPKGWCVMEGNYYGEFTFQLINGRGYKKEFEELIGWKPDYEFWWQDPSMRG